MLTDLGFADFDVNGILASLHARRDTDRKLAVTPDKLEGVGFRELALKQGN